MQSEPSLLNNLISNLDVSATADCLFRLAFGSDNEEHTSNTKTVSRDSLPLGLYLYPSFRSVVDGTRIHTETDSTIGRF